MELEDYYFLENIKMFLSKKSPQVRLPKYCKSLYELCINYNVKAFCLASSIIEVGVDIDRLSVMSIIGQPKTTAQYIQVSGRVGRKADERLGLVVTIYNNSKPRDKSHYEDFRGYHQRLYAKVEPSSVTPFSRPAIKRGMKAITVANIRQTSSVNVKPSDIDVSVIERWITELFKLRGSSMTEDEKIYLTSYLNKFLQRWDKVKTAYNEWGQLRPDSEPAQQDLLLPLGTSPKASSKIVCPTSMRNVDGESALWITGVYDQFEEEDDEGE
ncbi:helicase-related protein [Acinetobacter pseudolwoffii]|uniref:helicase-related protein n=1 Tax=Acinetobacter pseudolwoffii TaxID=2053287 RepID=UPI00209CB928|nr:helicase-related protein [Acinetobacter pseudolwoffii]